MRTRRHSQKGQALLEYILLLSVSVFMVLGLSYQFIQPFRNWMQEMFVGEDSYLGCLIKEGLLPGDANGRCEKPQFAKGSGSALGGGAAGGQTGSQGRSSLGSKSNSDASSSSKNSNANAASPGAKGISGNADAASAGSTTAAGETVAFKSGATRGSQGGGGGSTKTDEKVNTGTVSVSSTNGIDGQSTGSGGKDKFVPATGLLGKGGDDGKRTTSVPLNERDLKSKKDLIAEKVRKKQLEEKEYSGFDFGRIIRLLLIFALLFAIVFFVGSSLVSVSRGGGRR